MFDYLGVNMGKTRVGLTMPEQETFAVVRI